MADIKADVVKRAGTYCVQRMGSSATLLLGDTDILAAASM